MNILSNQNTETWSIYNAFVLTISLFITLACKTLNILLIVFSVSIISLIYINRKRLLKSKPIFGIANMITLSRLFIILTSFFLKDAIGHYMFFFSLSFAVILDFFDGLAARSFKEVSVFGQYFDMEVDAFFVLLMCLFYYTSGNISWWILIPGLLRYLFRIYTFCFPKPNAKEEKKIYATVIAASYFIILLIGLLTNGSTQFLILLSGSIAIGISFIIGIIQYHK